VFDNTESMQYLSSAVTRLLPISVSVPLFVLPFCHFFLSSLPSSCSERMGKNVALTPFHLLPPQLSQYDSLCDGFVYTHNGETRTTIWYVDRPTRLDYRNINLFTTR